MSRPAIVVAAAALASIGVVAMWGCGSESPGSPVVGTSAQAAPATTPLGVVAIDAQIGDDDVRSSGAVLDGDRGLVLTSAHTVWGARSLRVTTGVGVLLGRIVARAPCADLALVELQPRVPGLERIGAPANTLAAGQVVTVMGRRSATGAARGGSLVQRTVRVASLGGSVPVDRGLPDPGPEARLSGNLPEEAAGAPVTRDDGRMVALVLSAGGGRARALPMSTVQARLAELRPGPRRIYVGWREQYRCAGALSAFAQARHPGYHASDARLNAPVPATRVPGTSIRGGP